ncbi:MAG: DUF3341 domain-containing protein [Bryobacteraceae bacterium]|nr:DUF3341 domain-containing protein [Bryobacteraceae bacterium]
MALFPFPLPFLKSGAAVAPNPIYGVVGQFDRPEDLVRAGEELHKGRGYTKIDAVTPFPIHGIDDAIGTPPSKLGYIVFACGLFGLANAILMVWYTSAVDYRLVIGGKPLFAWEFSVPVLFELTVLFSAFGAVLGMFFLNGLPQFYHPLFNYQHFGSSTDDKYLLVVESSDPRFNVEEIRGVMEKLGAAHTEVVEA